jgi:uncharacterized protein involved in exopolysaccharide biosynthesis
VVRLSSPLVATTPAPDKGFDPEAEQEVDFARYGRMLARRWWLVAVGVVAGAVIGFLVSLGGTKLYSATSTIYVGQPYGPGGSNPVTTLQSNPSVVGQVANSQAVDKAIAKQCKTSVASFRKGISVQKVQTASTATKSAVIANPLVTVTVQTAKGKVAACAADGLANVAVARIGTYPQSKIKFYAGQVAADVAAIKTINAELANPATSQTDKLVLVQKLPAYQQDRETISGLLLLAQQVEKPRVTVHASAHQVSAQSPRNTVLIAALIGLILGVIGALLWDRIVPRVASANAS